MVLRIASSPAIQFLIGKDNKPMMIHMALVVAQSPALRNLLVHPMSEGQTRTVVWDDIDEETFGLFAQFAYTGDYTPPAHIIEELPVVRSRSSSPRHGRVATTEPEEPGYAKDYAVEVPVEAVPYDEQEEVFEEPRRSLAYRKKKKHRTYKRSSSSVSIPEPVVLSSPRVRFEDLSYPLLTRTINTSPRANESSNEDYSPVFLGHARLYVFAEKYDIEPLKAAALNKLHRTLSTFKLYEARYGDIVALISYTYDNTPSRRVMDPLREMLVHYVAYEATRVARCGQCMELVQENGSFASDLLGMVLERVA